MLQEQSGPDQYMTQTTSPNNPETGARRALITGITGQDGSYLAEFLLSKGYEVHGIVRRSSSFNTDRIEHLYVDPHSPKPAIFLHYGDLVDGIGLREILSRVKPDEVYNLGAQSHVRVSFDQPVYTVQTDALGTINLLEAIRDTGLPIRFYQASSSEMYGKVVETPQTEKTPFLSPQPVCLRQGLQLLADRELSRSVRHVRRATAFSSITKAPAAAKHLSPERSPAPPPASRKACRKSFTSATSTPSATGDLPAIMSKRCG